MVDWNRLVIAALEELGANRTLVRGAKFREKMDNLAVKEGGDLRGFLGSNGQKLGEFLDTVDGVVVHRRHGTDMWVGIEGPSWPTGEPEDISFYQREMAKLRADVYEALTRIRHKPYYYVRS